MKRENPELWKKAGKLTSEVREYGKSLIKKGAKISEITEKILKKIEEMNAMPAFPINISLNETAAHDTANINDERILNDEIVKLDLGIEIEGCIGDTAVTIDLSGKNQKLLEASKKALENALKIVKAGVKLGEIGKVIEDTITSYGFQPIRNLSGHSIEEYDLHSGTTIPNFDTEDETELEEGMIVAIEPFATTGIGFIEEKGSPQIYSIYNHNANIRIGRDVLTEIKEYATLPFSKQQIARKGFSEPKINMVLKILDNNNNLAKYATLVERSKGLVSQAEHTIFNKNDNSSQKNGYSRSIPNISFFKKRSNQ